MKNLQFVNAFVDGDIHGRLPHLVSDGHHNPLLVLVPAVLPFRALCGEPPNVSFTVVVTDDCPAKPFVDASPGYLDANAFVTAPCVHEFRVANFVVTTFFGFTPHHSVQLRNGFRKGGALTVLFFRAVGFGCKATKLSTQHRDVVFGVYHLRRLMLFSVFISCAGRHGFQCGDVAGRRIRADACMLDGYARRTLVKCGEVDVGCAHLELFRRQ
jgi:hypothetical protein